LLSAHPWIAATWVWKKTVLSDGAICAKRAGLMMGNPKEAACGLGRLSHQMVRVRWISAPATRGGHPSRGGLTTLVDLYLIFGFMRRANKTADRQHEHYIINLQTVHRLFARAISCTTFLSSQSSERQAHCI